MSQEDKQGAKRKAATLKLRLESLIKIHEELNRSLPSDYAAGMLDGLKQALIYIESVYAEDLRETE